MTSSPIKMCIDMTLPPWLRREARDLAIRENPLNAGKGAIPLGSKWETGRTLRVRFLDGNPVIQAKVQQMAMEWTEYANLALAFGDDPDAEIRVTFKQGGSWSFVGTDCLTIAKSRPTMNYGWLTPTTSDAEYARVVKHEFGHALGLIHEQQHPEAKIPWNKAAVYDYYMRTQGWTKAEIETNLFEKYAAGATQYSAYDKLSIMHYPFDKRLTDGVFEVGWNGKLSATDKEFIRAAYPPAPDFVAIDVGGAPTGASIGKHGEEDVFAFTAASKGVYTIVTQGKTDVFMSLFDGDRLVAEDDDSGYGTNAKVVSTLQPGTYTVRVRHYHPTSTGAYKIAVTRAE